MRASSAISKLMSRVCPMSWQMPTYSARKVGHERPQLPHRLQGSGHVFGSKILKRHTNALHLGHRYQFGDRPVGVSVAAPTFSSV